MENLLSPNRAMTSWCLGLALLATLLARCGGNPSDPGDTQAPDSNSSDGPIAPGSDSDQPDGNEPDLLNNDAVVPPVPFEQQDLFLAGEGGYQLYRIPSLLETSGGTLLAFAEGRNNGIYDSGDIDIVLRRSTDGGTTWSPLQVVVDNGTNTAGNPAPVVDRKTGVVWLPYCTNPADDAMDRRVWIIQSHDDGATWGSPVDITPMVMLEGWEWYATGPGRSIQLDSGRIVVPCDHRIVATGKMSSHVIYTDDGETWSIGGSLGPDTDESQVAELEDGSLIINARDNSQTQRRVVARSYDAGLTWEAQAFDQALQDPSCQGSLLATKHGLLFSNPASKKEMGRSTLTIRLSTDGGYSWASSRVLRQEPSAYSALAPLPDGRFGCLYEAGDTFPIAPYDRITLARFSLDWLTTSE